MPLSPFGGLKTFVPFLTLGAVLAAGCGPSTSTVKGTVKYNGNLVKGGRVSLYDSDNHGYNGDINEDGTYRITNVPSGEVKMTVDTSSFKPPPNGPRGTASQPQGGPQPPGMAYKGAGGNDPARYVEIPPIYADPGKTPLKFTVKAGDNTYDPEIK